MTFPFLKKPLRKRTPHYGMSGGVPAWGGPVERRDPRHYQRQSGDVGIRKCSNPCCRHWLGSHHQWCPICHEKQ